MSDKPLGKMTPAERAGVIARATEKFQKELTAAAPYIAEILAQHERDVDRYRELADRFPNVDETEEAELDELRETLGIPDPFAPEGNDS